MIVFVASLAATAGVTASVLPFLRRRLLDRPNARSSHASPTPRGGGVAVLAGIVVAQCVSATLGRPGPVEVIVPALFLGAVGLVDDFRSLGGLLRLLMQFGASAVLVIWIGAVSTGFGLGTVAAVVAVVACAGYVNAFNFMDGINGISGLNAAVCGAWFAFLGHDQHQPGLVVLGLAVAGAGLGFLPFNAPSARLFLGDVGSYGLGLLIAGMAVMAYQGGASLLFTIAPTLVYIADTGWVLVKRTVAQSPLMEAHREHVYQRLVDVLGWSHVQAAGLTAILAAALCVLAWAARSTGLVVPVSIVGAVLVGLYLTAPAAARARTSTP